MAGGRERGWERITVYECACGTRKKSADPERDPMSPPFVMTAHAALVTAERGIRLEWLEQALAGPDRIEMDRDDPSLCHALKSVPEFGGRVLRVVYDGSSTPWRVVTAYFDRSQRRRP
jgi:hypothetical protein